jgi:hypothetical protein
MLQADLYRDISRVTGETVATIKRVGFLIADPSQPISDPEAEDLGPHVLDWDEVLSNQDQTDAEYPIDFSLA